jgi:hypothetical protein
VRANGKESKKMKIRKVDAKNANIVEEIRCKIDPRNLSVWIGFIRKNTLTAAIINKIINDKLRDQS